jgi:hypothetical protein
MWNKFGSTGTVKKEYSVSVNTDSKKAHALALEAISAGSSDMYYTWHNKWRDIYGSKFPSA